MTDRPGPGPAAHEDVASYAIGALGDVDAARFEQHLIGCDACARHLEGFLPVVALLHEVPPVHVDLPRSPDQADADEVRARHRHRARMVAPLAPVRGLVAATRVQLRRPLVAAAAAAVAAVAVSAGVFGGLASQEILTTSAAGARTPASSPWDGLHGPDLEHGRRLSATDAGTGVSADVVLDSAQWGTRVSFALSRLGGPRSCRLVAVRSDGSTEVLSSWVVPSQGYGQDGQSPPLVLQAATALRLADISALRVDDVGQGGAWPLLTVPV